MTTRKTFKQEVLEIAEYLGCNGPELWNELKQALKKRLPEKREHEDGCSEGEDECLCGAESFNQAIEQVEGVLDGNSNN